MSYELNTDITSKVFYIDSRDATNYLQTNTDGDNITSYFQYTLQQPILIPQGMYCLTYLHSATIPYSFYNIRTGVNDTLIWSYSDFDGSNASDTEWVLRFKLDLTNYVAADTSSSALVVSQSAD